MRANRTGTFAEDWVRFDAPTELVTLAADESLKGLVIRAEWYFDVARKPRAGKVELHVGADARVVHSAIARMNEASYGYS